MTAIRKRAWAAPDGTAKTAWQVDYKDAGGKRRSKQFTRKKDAESWLTTAAFEVQQGVHTPDSQSITVAKAADLWIARGEREHLEVSTLAAYRQHVRLHIVPLCGDRKLSQITKPMVEGWRDDLMAKLSRPMALRVLRSLTAIIAEAQRRGYVAQNVAQGVRVRRAAREKPKVVIPSKADLKALIEAAQGSGDKRALAMVTTLIFAGLRASELRGLPWRDIDLKVGTITVSQRADLKNIIGPPKSASGHRTIPLPPLAVQALREWKLQCPKSADDLVFPSPAAKAMSHRYLTLNILGPALNAAGLVDSGENAVETPRYTLHDFRHAAASLWIDQRTSPKRVQRWMGHHSIQITYDVYGHLFDAAEQDSAVADAVQRDVLGETVAT